MEKVGNDFCIDSYLDAREKAIAAVKRVAELVKPGMNENQVKEVVEEILINLGSQKLWHPTKVRFGKNTVKSFREASEENVILQEEDIFFLDIGPVFDGHEADYGETFIVGNNDHHYKISRDAKNLFQITKEAWEREKLTGVELYKFAEKQADEMGYKLNLKMQGHRLSDFPHAIHYKGGLKTVDKVPVEDIWVLEIHICSKVGEYGAFYEDILTKNN
jgi:Xaa-Pro aminopeptidase